MKNFYEYLKRTGKTSEAVFLEVYDCPRDAVYLHQLWANGRCDPVQVEAWCRSQLNQLVLEGV